MKPVISYVYEYKGNQCLNNAGFLKMRKLESDSALLEFRMKSPDILSGDLWNLYAFHMENGTASLWEIGKIIGGPRTLEAKITLSFESLPTGLNQDMIDGFWVKNEEHPVTFIAAMADADISDIDSHKYQMWEDMEIAEAHPTAPGPESVADPEITASPEITANPKDSPSLNTAPANFRKIQRQDLTLLPRKEWYLANNSFLLHGYYNYHHLLVVEEETSLLLGVPGIYDRREARAAELFGFPEFSQEYVKYLELAEDEQNFDSTFGYYLRKIRLLVPGQLSPSGL